MSGIKEALAEKQAAANAAMRPTRRTVPDADGVAGLPRLFSDTEVAALLNMGRSTVWRRVAVGLLPRPIQVGGSSRWRSDELAAFIATATEARDAGEGRVNRSVEAAAAAKGPSGLPLLGRSDDPPCTSKNEPRRARAGLQVRLVRETTPGIAQSR